MVNIEIERNYIGNIYRFKVEGHTDSTDDDKMDAICAIVSVATQSVILGITSVLDVRIDFTTSDGFLECEIPEIDDSETLGKVNVLTETMLLTLKQAVDQYPSYIKLSEMEE